jgi:Type IV secretion-system coupling protein DNA-binding domain
MKRSVLEILANRENLDGPGAFDHILIVLHKVFDKHHKKHAHSWETFSFEITKIANVIRFFITTPEKYKDFVKNQIFAHYTGIEIYEVDDYLVHIPNNKIQIGKVELARHSLFPIKTFTEVQEEGTKTVIDPFSSITSALSTFSHTSLNTLQIVFSPIDDHEWKHDVEHKVEILTSKYPKFLKKIFLSKYYKLINIAFIPFRATSYIFSYLFLRDFSGAHWDAHGHDDHGHDAHGWAGHEWHGHVDDHHWEVKHLGVLKKISQSGYTTSINIIHASEDPYTAFLPIREIYATLSVYANFWNNSFKLKKITDDAREVEKVKNRSSWRRDEFILSSKELAGLVHLPTMYVKTPSIRWVTSRTFEPPVNLPIIQNRSTGDGKNDDVLTPIGSTNFRWTEIPFGIGPDDRRRHMYIIGKTGMWKSTLLENMIVDDMRKGRGLAVIDPHWDLAEGVIGYIPKNRTNHTIIFDPSDKEWPIAFNMLEDIDPELRPLIASGLIGIFKKIFWESWGPRLEHILRNTIMALLEAPNSTLISIPLMLTSEAFRSKVIARITDPVVRNFWVNEFAQFTPSQRVEAINPILNKVGQFLSSPLLRNILGQPKNSFSLRWAMDNGKIIIVNLSKGKIGEDASSLLGAMIITKFQLEAMSRADIGEKERKDFYLYVDEFQNFATDSFATILSEARKYKLNLVMANQYIDQMNETVRWAVFWNVWSIVSFQVGIHDAQILKDVMGGGMTEQDLVNIPKYSAYLKLLTDGMPSPIFSAHTFPPNQKDEAEFHTRYEKILTVSREKYCKAKEIVVEKINSMLKEIEEKEREYLKKKEEYKKQKEEEKRSKKEER